MKYYNRLIDEVLAFRLSAKGAILITGPKWCGKTTSAKRLAKSDINMQDRRNKEQYLALAKLDPDAILFGETPRLIDEWQLAPSLWDAVRQIVDERGLFGQFVLTGSSVPASRELNSHSGVGRIAEVQMRTMSLYESGDSSGVFSLKDIFDGVITKNSVMVQNSIHTVAYLICRGGWPQAIDSSVDINLQQAIDYFEMIYSHDIIEIDGIKRDPVRGKALLRTYARHISQPSSNSTILSDINKGDGNSIMNMDTFVSYANAFKRMFVIDEIEAWDPDFRSATAIRTSSIRHFSDPSIATAALGMSPNDLINDLKTMEFLFESMCIRDLRVYADVLNGSVFHYRDNSGLEVDAIIHLKDGRWGAIEMKLGYDEVPKAIANLKRLQEKAIRAAYSKPSFLMVITGNSVGYYDKDNNVWVVPITALKS